MTDKPLTLTRTEQQMLHVCIALVAGAGIYAWLVTELTFLTDRAAPALLMIALGCGTGLSALVSITLRRHGFLTDRSCP